VALVDINLPGMNGIECVTKLKVIGHYFDQLSIAD
jgi:CheY-like chemotaxis protein